MAILTETFGNVLVAHSPDDFRDDEAESFCRELKELVEEGNSRVVLQMDLTDHLDSLALELLVDLQDDIRARGGHLKVSGLTEVGSTVFEVTRLDRRFDTFSSVIDAVASFV